jgi:hypothetical protein
MRLSFTKRYGTLVKLIAIANRDPEYDGETRLRDVLLPFGNQGFADYGPREKLAPWLEDALRRLATARIAASGEITLAKVSLAGVPPVELLVGRDGLISRTMNFFHDQFLPALQGCDVRRIKVCPICNRLFVALRHDQPACSRKCANARRAREFRKRSKAYEANRLENQRRAAAREELKKQAASKRKGLSRDGAI